jgi:hypothetical protein
VVAVRQHGRLVEIASNDLEINNAIFSLYLCKYYGLLYYVDQAEADDEDDVDDVALFAFDTRRFPLIVMMREGGEVLS